MTPEETDSGAPSSRAVQERVLHYWETTDVIARALSVPGEGPLFRFTEGPPSANGSPHVGHLVARVLKDLQLRYHRMRGERIVSSMAGWDCHGLPVEIAIEKRHGLKSKQEIESYGVERFSDECRMITLEVADVWREMSRQVGYWLDYDHAYRTMDPPFIESVWWSLKQLFDRGLLEKGHYVLPYCPRCETPLASHEVAQGYREATDPSVTVRFPLTDPTTPRRSLLVWTTTPWTLPANLLAAARTDLEYPSCALRTERSSSWPPRPSPDTFRKLPTWWPASPARRFKAPATALPSTRRARAGTVPHRTGRLRHGGGGDRICSRRAELRTR